MPVFSSLTPCKSCNHEISIEAVSCPSCGAPNKWLHPSIEIFLREKDSTGVSEPFTFKYEKLKIHGETKKKVPGWINFAAIVIFLLVLAPVYLLGSFGGLFGPVGLLAIILAALFYGFLIDIIFGKQKKFSMNFETAEWSSSDEEFWAPVKKILLT